jgi:tetratricopeptide (TPR) repeat protein
MYKLALTLTPHDAAIAEDLDRIETRRRSLAEERYQAGERDYAAGKFRESKIAYLAALRMWPEHAGALERLRSREKITATNATRHTVQKGETLTNIAEKYYGDYKKFKMLADYNQLADPKKIKIGQVIMIPALGGGAAVTDGDSAAAGNDRRLPAEVEASISEAAQIQVANYRDEGQEMLRTDDYDAAIVAFGKVLKAHPEDTKARIAIGKAYDAYGRQLWDRQEIEPARRQFQSCLAYRDVCPACRKIVAVCEKSYKIRLYKRGIVFFEADDAAAALKEWEILQTIDPDYRKVKDYIRKADKLVEQPTGMENQQRTP